MNKGCRCNKHEECLRKEVEILLVRHGETTWNVSRRLQGNVVPGPGLTERGIQQSRCVFKWLDGVGQIYTSPLRRCAETLTHILSCGTIVNPLPVVQDDGLKERNLGEFAGCTIDNDVMQRIKINEGVETLDELISRSKVTMLGIAKHALERDIEKVMVLSHGGFISSVARFVDPNKKYHPVSNGSVSRLVACTCNRNQGIRWRIDSWNLQSHMIGLDEISDFGGGSSGG